MRISYFCTTWGQKNESWDAFFRKVKDAGYDGVETSLPPTDEQEDFLDNLSKHQLYFIGQHWETSTADFEAHKAEYTARLKALTELKPLFINSHTGKDHFNFEQNVALLQIASWISHESGIPVFHETHRGRFAFAAHITKPYLELAHPDLTLDVSHWCNVAESLLQDQTSALNVAIDHTRHIHARVGFEQGPQVPDFTLPQYQAALQFHFECWDRVVIMNKNKGTELLPITTEFGPPPYMQVNSTLDPTEKQWKLNTDLMNLLKKRYIAQT